MAYDVNTLTVKGAELLAAATAQDKLILDGCDATTVYITQANAQLVESRPVSPLSTTTTVSIIGYTSNHIVSRAEFNAGVNTGGDARTLYLFGHKESAPSDVYVIYVASDMDTFHLPVAGDVATQYETLFDIIYAVNPDAVETASTSIFTTLAEFNMLKERTVTTHAESEPTTGEDQTIYGTKTFDKVITTNTAAGFKHTSGTNGGAVTLINDNGIGLYLHLDGNDTQKIYMSKAGSITVATSIIANTSGASSHFYYLNANGYVNTPVIGNYVEESNERVHKSWIDLNYESATGTSSVNIETKNNNAINLAYNLNGNGSFGVKLNNTSMFSIYYNGADQEYQTSINSPLKVPEIRLTDDVITVKPGQITGTGDINVGKLTIHGSNLGCSVAIMEQLVYYMAGMSVSLNSSSVGEYHAYARGTTGVGSNGAELIMHHADTFANTNNEIILGLWNTNNDSWDGFSCEYDSVEGDNVVEITSAHNKINGKLTVDGNVRSTGSILGAVASYDSGTGNTSIPIGSLVLAVVSSTHSGALGKAGEVLNVTGSTVWLAYGDGNTINVATSSSRYIQGKFVALMDFDTTQNSLVLLQRID